MICENKSGSGGINNEYCNTKSNSVIVRRTILIVLDDLSMIALLNLDISIEFIPSHFYTINGKIKCFSSSILDFDTCFHYNRILT